MGEWLMAFFGFSQFQTFWNWIGLAADLFGIVALAITIWQIMQVKSKVNFSIDAMNELKRLQEQELLKKIFKELEGQQENLNWLLEKHGQSELRGYNGEGKKHLEEAEGYLYSAIQAVKVAEEQFSVDNIKMIAHSD